MNPFEHAQQIAYTLLGWALLSLMMGLGLLLTESPMLRAVGVQFVVWGAIDALIAAVGLRDRRRRMARGEAADRNQRLAFERHLRRLLRLNAGLDVAYLLIGLGLVLLWTTPEGLGHGTGVLIQGGFLLLFDAWHAWGVAPEAEA
jgi:hypothetical protein